MVLAASPNNEAGKASAKRLLFSKPSWSRTQNLGSSELFHRSEQVYIASAVELERKRRHKKSKEQLEGTPEVENAERATKRPRTFDDKEDLDEDEDEDDDVEDEDEDEDQDQNHVEADENGNDDSYHGTSERVGFADHPILDRNSHDTTEECQKESSTVPNVLRPTRTRNDSQTNSPSQRSAGAKKQELLVSAIIDLDDDEDDDDDNDDKILTDNSESPMTPIKTFAMTKVAEIDDIAASDEEFPELARKAREKARMSRLDKETAVPNSHIISSIASKISYSLPSEAPSSPDPVLQILITSSIPNTTPLIVSRKLSQRLKDVRLAWADRQHFPSDFAQHVFLTWRGKRLFDVTTCKSLGIVVDSEGRIIAKGDVLGTEEGRIHVEAMTSEILESRRKAKVEEVDDMEACDSGGQVEKKVDDQIRIILKAKGFEDCKLKVKANTMVSKILNAFRQANKVGGEKDVYIMFEGQRLDPDVTVGDAEIADLDTLDTYVK